MCPERRCEGISQKKTTSSDDGLYNGKRYGCDVGGMLVCVIASEDRTKLRFPEWMKCESLGFSTDLTGPAYHDCYSGLEISF